MKQMTAWCASLALSAGAVCFAQGSPPDSDRDFSSALNGAMAEVRGCAGDSCAQDPSRYFQSLGFDERREGRQWSWQSDTADGIVTVNVQRGFASFYSAKLLYRTCPDCESIIEMPLVGADDHTALDRMADRLAPFLGEDGRMQPGRVMNHPPIKERIAVATREYESYVRNQERTVTWLREHGFAQVQDLVLYNNAASWRRPSQDKNIPRLVQVDILKRYYHPGGRFPRASRDLGKPGLARIARWDAAGGEQVLKGGLDGSLSLAEFLSSSNLEYMEGLIREMDRAAAGPGSD